MIEFYQLSGNRWHIFRSTHPYQ